MKKAMFRQRYSELDNGTKVFTEKVEEIPEVVEEVKEEKKEVKKKNGRKFTI